MNVEDCFTVETHCSKPFHTVMQDRLGKRNIIRRTRMKHSANFESPKIFFGEAGLRIVVYFEWEYQPHMLMN